MKTEILDQSLHLLWSFTALLPVLIIPTWYMGLLSGFLVGAPREFVDQMTLREWKVQGPGLKKMMELGFFSLGGALAVLLVGAL